MNEKDKPLDFQLWEALKQKCCIKPESANTIVFLGAERFLEAVGPVLKKLRQEARAAAFREMGVIIDAAGAAWGEHARATKSKTYSAYAIAALDLKGRLIEAAASSVPKDNDKPNET